MLPHGQHKEEALGIIHRLCDDIRSRPLDNALELFLNEEYGAGTEAYETLARLLKVGVEEGWVGYVEIEGPDYRRGRIADPSPETGNMSVDAGLLRDVKGQYHCHTNGEINMVMPLEADAAFCGRGAGWLVFPPKSEHFPTVSGKALIMFFLPGGEIEYFTPPGI
ncbi:DUF4863 family protein [Paraburkholderia dipogonis]|uniref:DUF4863 family protein n=1 Tax=Paraburkholderia dipogonis TaxID=1211383 RepID=A0ABW9B0X7_9BURK